MVHHLDELAKDLAKGISRREILRRLGFGLAGAAISALGLASKSEAQVSKTGQCRRYCRENCPNLTKINLCASVCRDCTRDYGVFTINTCTVTLLDEDCTH
jgi:hypothetical protein